mmetsp:Transcript_54767/g.171873  ORF Transcript_54767/g.171873 Transcript_54767/m.171873 type:complete len:468 (+) Transcript_54767:3153-4556(+)
MLVDVGVDQLHEAVGVGLIGAARGRPKQRWSFLLLWLPQVVLAARDWHALRLLEDRGRQRGLETDAELRAHEEGHRVEDAHHQRQARVHRHEHADHRQLVLAVGSHRVRNPQHLDPLHVGQGPVDTEGGSQVHQDLVDEGQAGKLKDLPPGAEPQNHHVHVADLRAPLLDVLQPEPVEVLNCVGGLVLRKTWLAQVVRLDLRGGRVVAVPPAENPRRCPADAKPRERALLPGLLLRPQVGRLGLGEEAETRDRPDHAQHDDHHHRHVRAHGPDRQRVPVEEQDVLDERPLHRGLQPLEGARLPEVVGHLRHWRLAEAAVIHKAPGLHHVDLTLQQKRRRLCAAERPGPALVDCLHCRSVDLGLGHRSHGRGVDLGLFSPGVGLGHVRGVGLGPHARSIDLGIVGHRCHLRGVDLGARGPLWNLGAADLKPRLEKLHEGGASIVPAVLALRVAHRRCDLVHWLRDRHL